MNIRLLELKSNMNTLNHSFNETNNYSDSYYSDSYREGRDWYYYYTKCNYTNIL